MDDRLPRALQHVEAELQVEDEIAREVRRHLGRLEGRLDQPGCPELDRAHQPAARVLERQPHLGDVRVPAPPDGGLHLAQGKASQLGEPFGRHLARHRDREEPEAEEVAED